MVNKILASFIAADVLFVLCGGLLLAVALVSQAKIRGERDMDNVKEMILLEHCPLTGSFAAYLEFFWMFGEVLMTSSRSR